MGKLRNKYCPIAQAVCKDGKIWLGRFLALCGHAEDEAPGSAADPADPNTTDPYRVKCIFWSGTANRCKLETV